MVDVGADDDPQALGKAFVPQPALAQDGSVVVEAAAPKRRRPRRRRRKGKPASEGSAPAE